MRKKETYRLQQITQRIKNPHNWQTFLWDPELERKRANAWLQSYFR